MATAEELLAAQAGTDDKVCIIDLDTRRINIPKSIVALGVEADDDVHRLRFRMPVTYTGTDLSDLEIRINYMNANNEPDIYPVVDKSVTNGHIEFSWLVGDHALAYKGNVNFIVCMKKVGEDQTTVLREFNTTVTTLPVLEGLEVVTEPIEGELSDLLTSLQTQIQNAVSTATEKVGEKSQEEIEKIAAKGQDVLDSIPDNWETTHKLYRTRANAIVNTAEGSVISVNDASDDYLRGLRVFGKSTQVTTTGKNLVDLPQYIAKPSSAYNYDLFTGTSGQSTAVSSEYLDKLPYLQPGTYYFHVTVPDEYVSAGTKVLAVTDDGTIDNLLLNECGSFTLTAPTRVTIRIGSNSAFSVVDTQIESGDKYTGYEPYSGGHASPSPDWQQSIKNIENPSVSIHCKNLVRANYNKSETYEGMSVVITKGLSEVSLNGTATKSYGYAIAEGTYLTPGQYTMSVYGLNAADRAYLMNMNTRTKVCDNVRTDSPVTFNVTEAGIYRIDFVFANQTTYTNATVRFQIEAGDKGTDYEPIIAYQSMVIPITLPGIPVDSGGNYTDENGQQWVCDEIDFEHGKYVQRIDTQVFDGNEGWSLNATAVNDRGYTAYHITYASQQILRLGYCSHFANGGSWETTEPEVTNVFWVANASTIVFKTDGAQSLNEFKSMLRNAYTAKNPVTIYRVLQNPIIQTFEEKFEKETATALLAAYSALHSNYPTTTVMNDQGAHMEMKYNADTQIYLSNCWPVQIIVWEEDD